MTYSPIVVSARQVRALIEGRQAGLAAATASLDLGRSEVEIPLSDEGAFLPDGRVLSWAHINKINGDPDACWLVEEGVARKIHAFSEEMQRSMSLMATDTAPTLIIGGFTMHRIKRSDPRADTLNKIRAVSPVRGRVLDTATGLGYTAIEAAKTAASVTTIEIDPTVLAVARLNPWSRDLFDNAKIEQITGDAAEVVAAMPDASFDLVIHDPPTFSLAGELYSGAFYRELFRVLRPGGRLFHYIGNPESRHGGTHSSGVIRRLRGAGFSRIDGKPEAFGVVARRTNRK